MAVFGRKRFVSAELILDFTAVTLSFPFDVEVISFLLVDAVWFTELPLIFFSVCGIASLVLMSLLVLRHV